MSILKRDLGDTPNQLVPYRSSVAGTAVVSPDKAMKSSAVWACLRLRADLISSLPLCSFRQTSAGIEVEQPLTPFLRNPGNTQYGVTDWLYSSQIELDRTGNLFGIIRARDGYGLPSIVELVQTKDVTLRGNGSTIKGIKISGKDYPIPDIWHERQHTLPGIPLGLSPVMYGAMTIGTYLSAQQFAIDWFRNGAVPSGRLKNNAKTVNPTDADIIKQRFKAAVDGRDLFVHGMDWEYDLLSVPANESQFIQTMNFSIQDIARFFGVPGDMIDAPAESSAKITYANITQRNLQYVVTNLGPAITRREAALTAATPKPTTVRFDTDAFLRMDPETRSAVLNGEVWWRRLAPSEARAMDNKLPFTEDQLAEFDRLFPAAPPHPKSGAE